MRVFGGDTPEDTPEVTPEVLRLIKVLADEMIHKERQQKRLDVCMIQSDPDPQKVLE